MANGDRGTANGDARHGYRGGVLQDYGGQENQGHQQRGKTSRLHSMDIDGVRDLRGVVEVGIIRSDSSGTLEASVKGGKQGSEVAVGRDNL